jgi:TolA-binding protein
MNIKSTMKPLLPLLLATLFHATACTRKANPPVIYRPPTTTTTQPKSEPEKPPLEPVVLLPDEKPTPTPKVEPPTPEPEELVPSSFLIGEEKFASGSYQEAALSYEIFIKENPDHPKCDPANFRLGLSYAFTSNTARSRLRARQQLRSFIKKFPESPHRGQAEFILALEREIDKLRSDSLEKDKQIKRMAEELERLKKIDLEKRPTRPPH